MMLVIMSHFAEAQETITGIVTNDQNELLIGATVQWKGTSIGTVTDTIGQFTLPKQNKTDSLVVRYVGYAPITIEVLPSENHLWIEVQGVTLSTVVVKAYRPDNYVSTLQTRNLETISSNELKKAPCCNLSEAFETNGSIDVTYNDAVTGASEIQLLGLRGIYSQLQVENRPTLYGIGAAYALEYIPGTWLEQIQLSKGASSVMTGFQGITGQINTELMKPQTDKRLFINAFGSTMGRQELNVHLNTTTKNDWNIGAYLHESSFQNQIDHDDDGFMNMPLKKQINGLLRANKQTKNWAVQFNIQALRDQRDGGQVIDKSLPKAAIDTLRFWRMNMVANRVEAFGKLAYLGFTAPYRALGLVVSSTFHDQKGYFGIHNYIGNQRSFYSNLIYNDVIKTTDNKVTLGASFQLDAYKEQYQLKNYDRTEQMPGVFGELSLDRRTGNHTFNNVSLILAARVDFHNKFGTLFTPRANLKYNIDANTAIRLSAGRGFHSPNIIAENMGLFASSRTVQVLETLRIEDAWNVGGNMSKNFEWLNRKATFNFDLYRTQFRNQIVIDLDNDYRFINFYNLKGSSYANSLVAVLNTEIIENLSLRVGYKWNDVRTTYAERSDIQTLIPKHRGLVTLDYHNKPDTWRYHVTAQFIGKQRLPDNDQIPRKLHSTHDGITPNYMTMQAQITRASGQWEYYVGGENLTNYTQHHPITDAVNPFGQYFSAAQVWAPTMGIRGYAGVRYSIPNRNAASATMKNVFETKNILSNDASMRTERISVAGVCGMCKARIEKTALQNKAIYADWNVETHILTYQYNPRNTNSDAVEKAIAQVGHDTPTHKADDKTVAALPGCCVYR